MKTFKWTAPQIGRWRMERRQSLTVTELKASDYVSAFVIFIAGFYLSAIAISIVAVLLSGLIGGSRIGSWLINTITFVAFLYGTYRAFRFAVSRRLLALVKTVEQVDDEVVRDL